MVQTVLSAQKREGKGKGPARRLRSQGLIPAVVYGKQGEPVHLSVDPAALQKAIATPHKFNTIITLKLEGSPEKNVLFREYQVDPVDRHLLHADFLEVALDKPVRVNVPLVCTGRAEGVAAGGILQQNAHDIEVECLPSKIPVKIEVDVTALKVAQALHIADVKAPADVKIRYATNYTVAVVAIPEKEEVVAPVAVAVEGAVPGAPGAAPGAPGAPGAAGAAPAAGGKPGEKGAAPAAGAKPAPGAPPAKPGAGGDKGKK